MKLYLVQHGKAKNKEEDPDRHLCSEGIEDVHNITKFLKRKILKVDVIYHSGKPRAAETANILKKGIYTLNGVSGMDGLNPNDDVKKTAEFIINKNKDVMLVGHLPFLSRLTSFLIYHDENVITVDFQKGCVLCLSYNENLKSFEILWYITPDIIK